MEAAGVSAAQARNFAGRARLAAVNVPALPAPAQSAQPASSWETN
jgi:hypothetical protein